MHCATRWKVEGSIPDGDGIFHQHNPSGHNMALGSTQSLKEILSGGGGKGGQCIGLTTLPISCADSPADWEPHPFGTLNAC